MLRHLRKVNGFRRGFVAEQLNISPKYLNEIERGEGAMPKDRAVLLAKLYKVNANEILEVWEEKNNGKVTKKRNSNKRTSTESY